MPVMQAEVLRKEFEKNKDMVKFPALRNFVVRLSRLPVMVWLICIPVQTDVGQIGRLIQKGQAKLQEYQHPDPYIGKVPQISIAEAMLGSTGNIATDV